MGESVTVFWKYFIKFRYFLKDGLPKLLGQADSSLASFLFLVSVNGWWLSRETLLRASRKGVSQKLTIILDLWQKVGTVNSWWFPGKLWDGQHKAFEDHIQPHLLPQQVSSFYFALNFCSEHILFFKNSKNKKNKHLWFYAITHHCCYQGAFQELNILINRAHLVNVNLVLTESLSGKNYFSKTIKVISNLTNKHGIILSGQTFVQKWL